MTKDAVKKTAYFFNALLIPIGGELFPSS
jgi:hypothetical protein